ncbi:uncharacterized protein PAC_15449 [Phialocephala subalpina]|uniref:Glutaminase A central domain-containing protein n=1 Tax=Phialocephala subalpina TaxID=576137 RepID=A0A1L7XKI1_9HELO|nr:uncharacterized protein PAC_15449 [Phialocephala subalpina]
MPIFFYSNPLLVKLLLDPLFENQESGQFPLAYAMHDLGANYSRVIRHPTTDGQYMPLEECGNMIITTLAYTQRTQRTQDVAHLSQHYSILKQWTGYLVQEALIPANQLSTDDFRGQLANQTNLTLKGIIAIKAMSVITQKMGNTADEVHQLAVVLSANPPHTNLSYGDDSSHGLWPLLSRTTSDIDLGTLYNLYADDLLGLNLVPQRIYDMQSAFYPTVAQTYGVPLDGMFSQNVLTLPISRHFLTPLPSKTNTDFRKQRTGKSGQQQ